MIAQGLYDPANEHDACGVGFIAHIKGNKSHSIVEQGLLILKNLDHRGAVGADALMGDGAGILIQIPDQYYRDEMARQGVELPPPGEYGVGALLLVGGAHDEPVHGAVRVDDADRELGATDVERERGTRRCGHGVKVLPRGAARAALER